MTNTPVVLIIFNRPDHTRRVFDAIAQARPRTLFIVADGPRPDRPDDRERCRAARAVVERIDWPCEVVRDYAEENMGCGRRPASGISKALEMVEDAIILEDDCVPQPGFFRFCEELLERYRDDERVMMISGSNPLSRRQGLKHSYYFALATIGWGWATWRRAWRHYDMAMPAWPELRARGWLSEIFAQPRFAQYWDAHLERVYRSYQAPDLSVWDYQWFFTTWARNALAVYPRVNLVSNIGYGEDATHTTSDGSSVYFPSSALDFPLTHPPEIVWDRKADYLRMKQIRDEKPLYWRALMQVYGQVPRSVRRQISQARSQVLARLR